MEELNKWNKVSIKTKSQIKHDLEKEEQRMFDL